MATSDTGSNNLASHAAPERAPVADVIKTSGLRPTRQRLALGGLLFGGEDRHVTAEQLHAEVVALGEHVSLATVYNTLHQFCRAGLVRELAIDGSKAYFDTNTSNHNHFLLEDTGQLMDIPGDSIEVAGVPTPPEGMEITHIDVIVRLAKK
ncbi:MAG TPA: Fur family transcriptional regulator [Hyphomicrobium sp.]|nr:Fur family transcriptional regulator [Hyphomicrobium sp.]